MKQKRIFFILSLIWTIAWWIIAWSGPRILREYSFAPLWLGFIFAVNAICELLFGSSLLRKMGWNFLWLFVISLPLWWGFEVLNNVVGSWHYLGYTISRWHYDLQASIDFSTVVPAVLSVYYLIRSLFNVKLKPRKNVRVSDRVLLLVAASGLVSLALCLSFPHELFPFVWVSPLLIIDPLNYALGFPSVIALLAGKAYQAVVTIAASALITGYWWEMWNFHSFPKWYYTVPYFGFMKIFEMPLLGYFGYLTFGLIVWSYSMLALGLLKKDLVDVIA